MYTNFDPQFNEDSQISYPVEFIGNYVIACKSWIDYFLKSHCLAENAVFGKDDTMAVELPIAIDPNNEDSVIDRICYFVYGKFLLT